MLSLFYWIIDIKHFRQWTFFFVVIGMNSILIYLAGHIIDFEYAAHFLFGGLLHLFSKPIQAIGAVVAFLAVKWGFLYFLYRKNTFLRV